MYDLSSFVVNFIKFISVSFFLVLKVFNYDYTNYLVTI